MTYAEKKRIIETASHARTQMIQNFFTNLFFGTKQRLRARTV